MRPQIRRRPTSGASFRLIDRMAESDAAVVAQVCAGDSGAFRVLVDRHSRPVFRLAYRRTGNQQDAEDVVQETFMRAFRQLRRFESRASFGTWIHRIAVNCAILGIILFMVIRSYSFVQALLFGVGSGLGWWLAISALAAIREKIARNKLPRGLEGAGITFIITGLMALTFIGFSGIFNIQ